LSFEQAEEAQKKKVRFRAVIVELPIEVANATSAALKGRIYE